MKKYTAKQIAAENDALRKAIITPTGRVMFSSMVAYSDDFPAILEAFKSFDNFTKDNDPYKEHDCAVFEVNGDQYLFKVDYWDQDLKYGVDQYMDEAYRIITLMHVSER